MADADSSNVLLVDLTGPHWTMSKARKIIVYRTPDTDRPPNINLPEPVKKGESLYISSLEMEDGFVVDGIRIAPKTRDPAIYFTPAGRAYRPPKPSWKSIGFDGFTIHDSDFLRPANTEGGHVVVQYIPRQAGVARFVDREGSFQARRLDRQDLLVLRTVARNKDRKWPAVSVESEGDPAHWIMVYGWPLDLDRHEHLDPEFAETIAGIAEEI